MVVRWHTTLTSAVSKGNPACQGDVQEVVCRGSPPLVTNARRMGCHCHYADTICTTLAGTVRSTSCLASSTWHWVWWSLQRAACRIRSCPLASYSPLNLSVLRMFTHSLLLAWNTLPPLFGWFAQLNNAPSTAFLLLHSVFVFDCCLLLSFHGRGVLRANRWVQVQIHCYNYNASHVASFVFDTARVSCFVSVDR